MSKDTTHNLTIRLTHEQYGRLAAMGKLLHASLAEMVRGALTDYLDDADDAIVAIGGVVCREYAKEQGDDR